MIDFDTLKFPEDVAWIVLLLPLLAVFVTTVFTRRDAKLSGMISIVAVCLSFLVSVGLFVLIGATEAKSAASSALDWISISGTDGVSIELCLLLDPLSLLMLLVVTGVGAAIHIYSYGYMHDDPGMSRYFACLSLFTFSMLGIVLANNFVMMFIFWELVGVSSYLLIGFWHEKASAADAAKKAFITNRLGDFGFILGILLIWSATQGDLSFDALHARLATHPGALGPLACVAGLLIFCGAVGKSAQFPLHVWLPDAMEGPTPVSALIHAATMVAAGVYMLCRVFFLFTVPAAWPVSLSFMQGFTALDVIAWIGGVTALLAALIAVQQNDIKRILAYSTLSQLGYMVMAVGLSTAKAGPTPAMFHLVTHAFFKALLFLGAGSVILALHHEQDIWKMGGLKKKMPVTYWTFLIGTLALCGVPPLSGFYSKDSILALAASRNVALFIVGLLTAVLTAFYMFRLYFVALVGRERSEAASHAHESPRVMTMPLVLLALGSVTAGFVGVEGVLNKVLVSSAELHALPWHKAILAPFSHAPMAALAGLGAVILGFSIAFGLYHNAATDPLPEKLGFVARAMRNRFYFDEIYQFLIRCAHEVASHAADWFDRWIIAGICVRGASSGTDLFGRALRLVQTGNLQTYAFLFVVGVALVLWFVLQ
ncbi:MAG: NADH-quinone oxidoreductase subunit L [Verrucomicrobia bacterium]|nr:NADH-quinone oxidoreductase subunit L [Verrucomicrobiota bacterium]